MQSYRVLGIIVNDRQVREKHIYHFIDKACPRAEIEVRKVTRKISIVDNDDGTVTINGTKYSYEFFSEFGCSFPNMEGQVLRIDRKEDGVVTVTRLMEMEGKG